MLRPGVELIMEGHTEAYKALIEELKATITEGVYNSRWELLKTYHEVGELLTSHRDLTQDVKMVAVDSGISERTLQRCTRFYEKYPDMEKLPEGKAISWHKLVNKYLPEHKEEGTVEEFEVCPMCQGKGRVKK